jgi:hypothetical protein
MKVEGMKGYQLYTNARTNSKNQYLNWLAKNRTQLQIKRNWDVVATLLLIIILFTTAMALLSQTKKSFLNNFSYIQITDKQVEALSLTWLTKGLRSK